MGKRVRVDGVGFGVLRFFGAAGEDSQCGVELEEPLVSTVRSAYSREIHKRNILERWVDSGGLAGLLCTQEKADTTPPGGFHDRAGACAAILWWSSHPISLTLHFYRFSKQFSSPSLLS